MFILFTCALGRLEEDPAAKKPKIDFAAMNMAAASMMPIMPGVSPMMMGTMMPGMMPPMVMPGMPAAQPLYVCLFACTFLSVFFLMSVCGSVHLCVIVSTSFPITHAILSPKSTSSKFHWCSQPWWCYSTCH